VHGPPTGMGGPAPPRGLFSEIGCADVLLADRRRIEVKATELSFLRVKGGVAAAVLKARN
jgi:hypothetical protein